ncbi:DUF1579 domain-containing protein [Nocardioides sp. B-3]|uniref:DUF1579 domain-containing protein n=1 Tax=Nocardioides sp. B-3 TaxID=2895565 RepID=UPI0021525672|nr:DUF1579 domain-containing protein [Nocardioides sp. B-3]UUZ61004.1 DUF1579 domain-containing protein [Nocardioides sp. B-3]
MTSSSETDNRATDMMPTPDPALRQLERFVGTWTMAGRLEGREEDTIHGRTTYEWLPGGFFLKQHMTMDFAGYVEIDSTEIVRYDPETGTFPSQVFSNISPEPLPYSWQLDGDQLRISVSYGPLDATFEGRFSDDGDSFSGARSPNPGADPEANIPYTIGGRRVV